MKKIIPLVLIGVLVLSGLGAGAIDNEQHTKTLIETITISEPTFSEYEHFITVDIAEETSHTTTTGHPLLPIISKVYTFPLGTHIEDVRVVFSEPYDLVVTKRVQPAPAPQYIATELRTQQSKEDSLQMYETTALYPDEKFTYRTSAGLKNQDHVIFLSVHVCPVTYLSQSNLLRISDAIHIIVSYTQEENPLTFGDAYDLLILAPAEFSTALQPLVDHKNQHDILTTLVTLDDIPSQGDDQQEDIKLYIKDAIETWGISYVLLVGSGLENEEMFPVRYAWVPSGGYEQKFPSDLYYADIYDASMGFSSWDANDNGKYAEFPDDNDAVDLHPDVALGRLACNDVAEVENAVEKIINYMDHNAMMNTIVQIGGDTFPGDPEDINEGEFANAEVMEKLPGYSTTQLWGSNGELTKINIIKAFYDGVDFVDFSGHGSPVSWATHPPGDEETWIPEGVKYTGFLYLDYSWMYNKKKLPVIMFNGCSCSKYSATPNCLGWAALQKENGGAIATFGASGIGYGSYGSYETQRLFGWMEVHIFEGLYNDKILGDVWMNCISTYADSFEELEDADYKTMEELALLGDPSLAINDGPEPESETIIHPGFPLFLRLLERFPLLERLFSFPLLSRLF
jgi:hypothetical protein